MANDFPTLSQADRSDDFALLKLPDGRDLAFMEWGEPGGFPAFYFHGTPSSRLEGAFADAAARRHSFRRRNARAYQCNFPTTLLFLIHC